MEEHEKPINQVAARSVGEQLRAAREAAGRSRGDIAAQTRVAERHLAAIEEDRFADLAAPTYAVGFSRAYARAVGLDEAEIAKRVRRQLDAQNYSRPTPTPSFEPGDPARVPPSRVAWIAGLLIIVAVVGLLLSWNSFLSPEGQLPDLLPEDGQSETAPAPPAAPQAATTTAAAQGPVVLTAAAPNVWIKVTDGSGAQLFQKELAQGETYTVPADAREPQLRTARGDVLQITVGGQVLPRLSSKPEVLSRVLLTPAALAERTRGLATPPAAAPSGTDRATGANTGTARPAPQPSMDDLLGGAPTQAPRAGGAAAPANAPGGDPVSTTSR